MVRGDGGFTEGMLFVIFFDQGDAIPPHPPSIRALYLCLERSNRASMSMIQTLSSPYIKKISGERGTEPLVAIRNLTARCR